MKNELGLQLVILCLMQSGKLLVGLTLNFISQLSNLIELRPNFALQRKEFGVVGVYGQPLLDKLQCTAILAPLGSACPHYVQ